MSPVDEEKLRLQKEAIDRIAAERFYFMGIREEQLPIAHLCKAVSIKMFPIAKCPDCRGFIDGSFDLYK